MVEKLKVLLIDPWGINNTAEYLNGLISGLSSKTELFVFTNRYFVEQSPSEAHIFRTFFGISENMKPNIIRKVIRGLEYSFTYKKIISYLKKHRMDVVHINWLLNYKADIRNLRRIKKLSNKIVYTAHNVLPHTNGDASKEELREIYSIVDKIIVHGENIKSEMIELFPDTGEKIYVQKHGAIIKEPPFPDNNVLNSEIIEKCKKYSKILLYCGLIFPNKGVARLAKIWIKSFSSSDALLIIGGRQTDNYPEYDQIKSSFSKLENTVLIDGYIPDKVLEALFTVCSVVILPYEHASMSGVVFFSAQYKKTLISTNVGSIPEYLENGSDSFVCDNSNEGISQALQTVLSMDDSELSKMGIRLNQNILYKCDWDNICSGIINQTYKESYE